MKKCPFCSEDVQDGAIKCRYCFSSLLPPPSTQDPSGTAPKVGPNQVTYVLDRDLIRFGKFAVSLLAIFATVGAFVWGFKIDESANHVEQSAEKVQTASDNMRKISDDVAKEREQMGKDVAQAQSALAAVQGRTG